jgi:hypothetical protein
VDAANGDLHLGLHSPAIDAGDPDSGLQDPDGSRGDMGFYGSHAFTMDQPQSPVNLVGSVSGGDVVLTWSPNPEGDLASYAVYCDSSAGFVPTVANFVTSVAAGDTSVSLGPASGVAHYKISAIDAAGYAGGYSNEAQVDGTTDARDPQLPLRFHLYANTPNPFNPYTRIDFELDYARHVSVAIYDLAGRRVRHLVDSPMPAGRHSTLWDGRDQRGRRVASGVYFSRMQSDDRVQTRKMVMLK